MKGQHLSWSRPAHLRDWLASFYLKPAFQYSIYHIVSHLTKALLTSRVCFIPLASIFFHYRGLATVVQWGKIEKLVSKDTVMLGRWGGEILKFDIWQVDKAQISTWRRYEIRKLTVRALVARNVTSVISSWWKFDPYRLHWYQIAWKMSQTHSQSRF